MKTIIDKKRTSCTCRARIAAIVAVFSLCLCVHAGWFDDVFSSGEYATGGEYLRLPVTAATAGLEGATVAWESGTAGRQSNPAVLDAMDSITVTGTTSFMTEDRKHFGVEAASPIGEYLTAGLSFMQFGMGNFDGRNEFGEPTGSFSSSFNTLTAVAAGRLAASLSVGMQGRYILESIDNEHSNGFGFDIGTTWRPLRQLCVGASLRNLVSYSWWSTGSRSEIPLCAQVGVCGSFLKQSLRMELDLVKTVRQPEEAAFGAEYVFLGCFMARAGVRSAAIASSRTIRKPEYSFGAGMRYDFIGFDYSITMPPAGFGVVHKISVLARIEKY